jgi:hypothetical protein
MRICSFAICSDKYQKSDAGPLRRGVGSSPTKQNKLRSERGQTLLSDIYLYCGSNCRLQALCESSEPGDIFEANKKQRHSMFLLVTHLSYIKLTLIGWHKKRFAGYGWLRKLFKSRQIINTECGKESVPLLVNKPRHTKSSFNNTSTKFQHDTCRGRKHHQERERYKLYWVFLLSP